MKCSTLILFFFLLLNSFLKSQSDSSLNILYLAYWGDGQNRQVESLASIDNLIAVGLESYFQLVDFSNPNWPQTKGDYHLWGQGFVKEIGLYENAAYLFTRNGRGKIMDISDIENLVLIGDISLGRFFSFDESYLVAPGCISYIADFRIFDISVPLNPIFINEFDLNQYSCELYSILVRNNLIFFLGNETWPSNERYFLIIDISDPYTPDVIYSQLSTSIVNFTIDNHLLLAMEGGTEPGIHIYDITQPSTPEEKGYYECNGWILGIQNEFCYYAPMEYPANTICMLDISSPSFIVNSGYYYSSDFNFRPAYSGYTIYGHTVFSGSRIYHANGTNRVYLLRNDLISSVNEYDEIKSFLLEQNFPNPFNPKTTIKYQIPELSFVTIKVYDVLGNEVAAVVNEEKSTGEYEVEFSATGGGKGLTSGIYFYQLRAGNFIETMKMVLMK